MGWSCIPVGATAKGKQTWENNHFTYGWSRILGLFLWLWHTLNTRKSSLFFLTQTLKTAHVRRYQMLFRNIYIAQTLHDEIGKLAHSMRSCLAVCIVWTLTSTMVTLPCDVLDCGKTTKQLLNMLYKISSCKHSLQEPAHYFLWAHPVKV